GLVHKGEGPIKLLGDGEIGVALDVQVDRVSAHARAKIEAAGGTVQELKPRKQPAAEAKATAERPARRRAATEPPAPHPPAAEPPAAEPPATATEPEEQ